MITEIRRNTIPVFMNMMDCELQSTGDFRRVTIIAVLSIYSNESLYVCYENRLSQSLLIN